MAATAVHSDTRIDERGPVTLGGAKPARLDGSSRLSSLAQGLPTTQLDRSFYDLTAAVSAGLKDGRTKVATSLQLSAGIPIEQCNLSQTLERVTGLVMEHQSAGQNLVEAASVLHSLQRAHKQIDTGSQQGILRGIEEERANVEGLLGRVAQGLDSENPKNRLAERRALLIERTIEELGFRFHAEARADLVKAFIQKIDSNTGLLSVEANGLGAPAVVSAVRRQLEAFETNLSKIRDLVEPFKVSNVSSVRFSTTQALGGAAAVAPTVERAPEQAKLIERRDSQTAHTELSHMKVSVDSLYVGEQRVGTAVRFKSAFGHTFEFRDVDQHSVDERLKRASSKTDNHKLLSEIKSLIEQQRSKDVSCGSGASFTDLLSRNGFFIVPGSDVVTLRGTDIRGTVDTFGGGSFDYLQTVADAARGKLKVSFNLPVVAVGSKASVGQNGALEKIELTLDRAAGTVAHKLYFRAAEGAQPGLAEFTSPLNAFSSDSLQEAALKLVKAKDLDSRLVEMLTENPQTRIRSLKNIFLLDSSQPLTLRLANGGQIENVMVKAKELAIKGSNCDVRGLVAEVSRDICFRIRGAGGRVFGSKLVSESGEVRGEISQVMLRNVEIHGVKSNLALIDNSYHGCGPELARGFGGVGRYSEQMRQPDTVRELLSTFVGRLRQRIAPAKSPSHEIFTWNKD